MCVSAWTVSRRVVVLGYSRRSFRRHRLRCVSSLFRPRLPFPLLTNTHTHTHTYSLKTITTSTFAQVQLCNCYPFVSTGQPSIGSSVHTHTHTRIHSILFNTLVKQFRTFSSYSVARHSTVHNSQPFVGSIIFQHYTVCSTHSFGLPVFVSAPTFHLVVHILPLVAHFSCCTSRSAPPATETAKKNCIPISCWLCAHHTHTHTLTLFSHTFLFRFDRFFSLCVG